MIFGGLIDGLRRVFPSTPGNRLELADRIERINRELSEAISSLTDEELFSTCSQFRIDIAQTGVDAYLVLVEPLPARLRCELAARSAFAEIVVLWRAYINKNLPYSDPVRRLLVEFSGAYADSPLRELPNLIETYTAKMRAAEEVLSARH